jgi:diguanylate cyclase
LQNAIKLSDQIRERIAARELRKRSTGESLGRITVSIGVASRRSGERPRQIIERADSCLYEAKRAGRNCTMHDVTLLGMQGDAA